MRLVELPAQAPAQVGLQQRARRIQVVRHPVERSVKGNIGIVCMQLQCQRHRGRFERALPQHRRGAQQSHMGFTRLRVAIARQDEMPEGLFVIPAHPFPSRQRQGRIGGIFRGMALRQASQPLAAGLVQLLGRT